MISTGGGDCSGRLAAVSLKLEVEARYLIVRMFCLLCSRAVALLLLRTGGISSVGETTIVGVAITIKGIVGVAFGRQSRKGKHNGQFTAM